MESILFGLKKNRPLLNKILKVFISSSKKGIILMDEVKQIIPKQSDQRIFSIVYKERSFILRAEKLEVRDRWVKYLQIILEHHKKLNKNKKKTEDSKLQSWKWKVVDQQISNKIRIQNQKILLSEGTIDVAQKSLSFLLQNVKFGTYFQHQKYVIHGFHKQKSFISQNQYWHFICSEFNLYEQKDDNMNETIKQQLENIGKKMPTIKKKKKSESESQSSQSEEEEIAQNQPTFTINKLYIFSQQEKKLVQTIHIEEIISWQQSIDSGYKLIIKYLPFQNAQFDIAQDDKQKQYIIQSDFLYQIKKLSKGIKVIYEKYSIKKTREEMLNKRFQRFQMKGYKVNDSDWKIFDSKTFILLNLEMINVQGTNYYLNQIFGDINKEACSDLPAQENEQKAPQQQNSKKKENKNARNYLQFHTKQTKIKLLMHSQQIQKSLHKKLTKLLKKFRKKIQSQKKILKSASIQEQQSMKTYFIDKKLRQTSNSIKTNYYQLMNRQVPKRTVPAQDNTFWGKIMNMFCGGFKDDQLGL